MTQVGILNSGPLIEELGRDLGISVETIALALDVDRRTVERWRANQNGPQGKTRQRLADLLELRDLLLRMFGTPQHAQG